MNANEHGFKDETEPGILIQAPDYGMKPVDEKLDQRSINMLGRANAFVCKSPEDYKMGDQAVSECAALVKRIKELHDPICDATNIAHKVATGARKKLIDPINAASKIIDTRLGNFKMAYERKIAAETKALEEEVRKAQEESSLAQAVDLEEAGAPEELVDDVLATADEPAAAMKPEAPALSSNNSRTPDWDIEIINEIMIPLKYRTVDEAKIRKAVRESKGTLKITGVRVIETFKTRRRAL